MPNYTSTIPVMNQTMQLALSKLGFRTSRPKRAQWPRVREKFIQVEVNASGTIPFVR